MAFEDEYNKEVQAVLNANNEVLKVTAIEYFSGVILQTPVGNPQLWKSPPPPGYTGGSARANWFLTFVNPSSRTTQEKDTGNKTSSEIVQQIAKQTREQYILTNNLPYIERLSNGWSTQADSGWIERQRQRVEQQVPQIQREANRKFGVPNG